MVQCYSSLIEPAIVLLLEATIAESMFDEYDQVLMIKKINSLEECIFFLFIAILVLLLMGPYISLSRHLILCP